MQKFTLNIHAVISGWADIACSIDGHDIGLRASYLRDSLTELLTLSAGIATCHGVFTESRRLLWVVEPGAVEWNMTGSDEGLLSISILGHTHAFPTPGKHERELGLVHVPAVRFVRSVLRAFDDLAERTSPSEFETEWRHRWPQDGIARLRAAIRSA